MSSAKNVPIFANVSHQTRLDSRSKAQRPIKVGIKGRGRSGTSRDSNPAGLCCSSAHLVQCEPDEASSFTNPNVGPGTYANLRLKLDARSSAIRYKGDKTAARPPEGSLVETRSLKAPRLPLFLLQNHAPDRSPEQAPGCSPERTCPRVLKKACWH